jgi:hypothetical protein
MYVDIAACCGSLCDLLEQPLKLLRSEADAQCMQAAAVATIGAAQSAQQAKAPGRAEAPAAAPAAAETVRAQTSASLKPATLDMHASHEPCSATSLHS